MGAGVIGNAYRSKRCRAAVQMSCSGLVQISDWGSKPVNS